MVSIIVLKQSFFRKNTVDLAKDLLGKVLCVKDKNSQIIYQGIINETEAYHGYEDDASHGHKKITPRNKIMYDTVGHTYVYFTYGMHYLFNITSFEEKFPAAVLIRSLIINEDNPNLDLIAMNRFNKSFGELSSFQKKNLTNGPAKLTKAFKIDKSLNELKLGIEQGIWIEDQGIIIPKERIQATPRVGIDYATNAKDWPWRFYY